MGKVGRHFPNNTDTWVAARVHLWQFLLTLTPFPLRASLTAQLTMGTGEQLWHILNLLIQIQNLQHKPGQSLIWNSLTPIPFYNFL